MAFIPSSGGIPKNATQLPISGNDPTDTKNYIDTGLSGKANKSDFIITDVFSIDNQTVSNNTDYYLSKDVTKTGYTPIGIIQTRLLGSYDSRFHVYTAYINSGLAYISIRANTNESFTISNFSVEFTVLYIKT